MNTLDTFTSSTKQLKTKKMNLVQILKNGKPVKQFSCPVSMVQKYFQLAVDIAGGMYNGKDKFVVKIIDVNTTN